MSRSNAPAAHPGTQAGGWSQQRPAHPGAQAQQPAPLSPEQAAYEQDLAAWNAQQQSRWPQQAPTPGHPQHGYAPPAEPTPRTAPPAYHYPAAAEGHDPYSRPTLGARETTAPPQAYGQPYAAAHAQPSYPPQSYAPEFDPYTPPAPQTAGATGYGAQPGYGHLAQPPAYGGSHYAESAPAYAPAGHEPLSSLQRSPAAAPELRGAHYDQGFEQWSQPAYQPPQASPDPRGYDLGGYAPAAAEPAYRQALPLDHGQNEWAGHGETYPQGAYDAYGQPQPFPQHHGHAQGGFDPAAHAHNPAAQAQAGGQLEPAYQHDEAGAEYELDEPPAGRRWGLIAAALVGAVAVGSGMAYGYKMIYGSAPVTASAPIVKNNGVPTKVKPAEPGGKQFAHTDSKIMGRLNDQSAAAAAGPAATAPTAASTDSDPNGARKVQTVVIGRDGSIVPPAPPPAAPPAALGGPQPVAVPGMTIVDGFGGRPPAATLATPAAPSPARPVVVNPPAAAAPAKPTVLARAEPATVSDAAAVAVTKSAPAKVAIPKKVAAATPAAAAAPAATGANGFVVVLASVPASQKSSMDALKQFADMQQKYGTALANKTPEVREANLGDKGTYHRLLVGPPGSREQAGQLCTQLKAAGYGGCWVTAY